MPETIAEILADVHTVEPAYNVQYFQPGTTQYDGLVEIINDMAAKYRRMRFAGVLWFANHYVAVVKIAAGLQLWTWSDELQLWEEDEGNAPRSKAS